MSCSKLLTRVHQALDPHVRCLLCAANMFTDKKPFRALLLTVCSHASCLCLAACDPGARPILPAHKRHAASKTVFVAAYF